MHFAFDDEQLSFRDAVRDLLAKHGGIETARAAWDAPPGRLDRRLWEALAEMGVLTMLVPDDIGGLGLDERSLVLLLEEAGYACVPHPLVDSAAVVLPLADDQLSGTELVVTDLGGPHVSCAADADHLLLQTAAGALHLVPRDEVSVEPIDAVDRARRLGRVSWEPADATFLTDDRSEVLNAFDRGALGTAATLVGLAQRSLDLTVEYVRQREQFGAPIGSFQAVKHHLADAAKALTFARPAVYRASWSLAIGQRTDERDVSIAKALASDAALQAGRAALQCHGAIGYTVEHDLHLLLKRSWALARAWGDAAWHRDQIGHALGI
jgi:alkylation response protein AidB-like acyl-CoA dehydrogenase